MEKKQKYLNDFQVVKVLNRNNLEEEFTTLLLPLNLEERGGYNHALKMAFRIFPKKIADLTVEKRVEQSLYMKLLQHLFFAPENLRMLQKHNYLIVEEANVVLALGTLYLEKDFLSTIFFANEPK